MALLPYTKYESVGQLFAFDRFLDLVGEGAFAEVYRATVVCDIPAANLTAGQVVALKVIRRSKLDCDKAIRDVIKEVEMCRKLDHPCCVPIHHVVQTATEIFIVMEFVEGKELFQMIGDSSHGQLPEKVARLIAFQLLQGLDYLHCARKIVHRDLKPENVMISGVADDPSNPIRVRLVDFGLAKYIGTSQRRTKLLGGPSANRLQLPRPNFEYRGLTRSVSTASVESAESTNSHTSSPLLTTPCGTLKYNAPEAVATMMGSGTNMQQTTKGELIKRDIFSLGSVVFVMLSGRLPFTANTKTLLLEQMKAGPAMTSSRWNSVSNDAKTVVGLLLSLDPGLRPTAASALQHSWFAGLATTSTSSSFSPTYGSQTQVADGAAVVAETDGNQPRSMGRKAFSMAFDSIIDADDDDNTNAQRSDPIVPSSAVSHAKFYSGPFPAVVPCDED